MQECICVKKNCWVTSKRVTLPHAMLVNSRKIVEYIDTIQSSFKYHEPRTDESRGKQAYLLRVTLVGNSEGSFHFIHASNPC